MRIAQVTCTFPPYKGGIGNMAYDHAFGLTKLGHDVEVFTPKYRPLGKKVETDFKVNWLKPWLKWGNGAFIPQLLWKLKDFDIVHLHYPFFGGAELVWFLKLLKKDKMKLIITYHMDNVSKGLFGLIYKINSKLFMPLILKSADKVICTSYDYLENSSASSFYKNEGSRVVSLPPSVDIERFTPKSKNLDLLRKYQIKASEKVVLFVGGLDKAHYFKGIDFLLQSWQEIHDAKLLIVGQGSLREKYKSLAKKLNIDKSVVFSKVVPNDQLPDYYNLADFLILPSIDSSEAFGIVLIEAMASGKPVLASNLPGVRSVIDEGVNGYKFELKNKNKLVEKMKALILNDDKRIKMGENARQMAEQNYAQEKIWKDLEDVYFMVKT